MNTVEIIGMDRIDFQNRRFCISYPIENPLLLSSIERVGIIQPVILCGEPPYIIVAGFKRIEAANRLGHRTVPALVKAKIYDREALLMAIHDNVLRGLNLAERACAVEKMGHMGFADQEIWDIMILLGFKPHDKVRSALIAVARSEEILKTFIVSRALSMRSVEGLLRFDSAEREQLLKVLTSIHTTEGSFREILRILALLKLKEGKIDFDIFVGAETTDEMRVRLKRRAYPILTSLEKRLEAAKGRAALPPHMDIRVDPFFEKEYIDIDIRARNIEDIEYALERLRKTLEDGSIGSILELTKG